jgi:hypothetical protein
MNEQSVHEFVKQYTKGIDLMNCALHAIENNFEEPADYDSYGCGIRFLKREQCSVQDEEEVNGWYVHHHNTFAQKKIDGEAPKGFCFPPPYNFIEDDDITIDELNHESAKVEVSTQNMNYEFSIVPSEESESGLAIKAIVGTLPFGGPPIEIL